MIVTERMRKEKEEKAMERTMRGLRRSEEADVSMWSGASHSISLTLFRHFLHSGMDNHLFIHCRMSRIILIMGKLERGMEWRQKKKKKRL